MLDGESDERHSSSLFLEINSFSLRCMFLCFTPLAGFRSVGEWNNNYPVLDEGKGNHRNHDNLRIVFFCAPAEINGAELLTSRLGTEFYANRGMFPASGRERTDGTSLAMINSTSQSPGDESLRREFGAARSHCSFFTFVTKHWGNQARTAIMHHLPLYSLIHCAV